jgi:hypothetical protein
MKIYFKFHYFPYQTILLFQEISKIHGAWRGQWGRMVCNLGYTCVWGPSWQRDM